MARIDDMLRRLINCRFIIIIRYTGFHQVITAPVGATILQNVGIYEHLVEIVRASTVVGQGLKGVFHARLDECW